MADPDSFGPLTDDWTFVLPSDASFSEPQLTSGANSESPIPRREDGPPPEAVTKSHGSADDHTMMTPEAAFSVAGVPVSAIVGDMEIGSLDPVGDPIHLGGAMDDIIGPANDRLDVEVMKRDFNPFIAGPVDAQNDPLIGPFDQPGEIYQGKAFIPVKKLLQALAEHMGEPIAALQPLIDAVNENAAIRTSAHQFNVLSVPGNAVVFYGGDSVGHQNIDKIVSALGDRHMRIVRQMVHFDLAGQGGSPRAIIADGVGGSTHSGGYSLGYRNGGQISVKSDWPSNYGRLDDGNITYNAHLFAIDYQQGTRDPIPEHVLAAYKRNADMWDCCAGMVVPFTSAELDPDHRDYQFNPLEVHDQASARAVARTLAQMDRDTFLREHGAFYCSEGQYSVANLGPQEDESGGTLLKRSRYGDTVFGRLITNFQNAPGYQSMSIDDCRKQPEIGWKYLNDIGQAQGGISDAQFDALEETDRTAVFFEWIEEDCPGWQTYHPINGDGLIARPMTVVTMAWGILRRYLPRESIARAVALEILRAYQTGDANAKQAVIVLCRGQEPDTEAGKMALASAAMKAATGMILGIMNSDEFRNKLLEKAGFEQITNDADKQLVLAEYANFVAIMKNANHSSQDALDAAVLEADARFGELIVERRHFNPATGQHVPKRKMLMKYAAPSCVGIWAQQPFLAGTGCLRYVATAMHVEQSVQTAVD